jgi:hypothetical protein
MMMMMIVMSGVNTNVWNEMDMSWFGPETTSPAHQIGSFWNCFTLHMVWNIVSHSNEKTKIENRMLRRIFEPKREELAGGRMKKIAWSAS